MAKKNGPTGTSIDLKRLRLEYESLVPTLSAFRNELDRQLSTIVEECRVTLGFPIQSRVKTWDSIAEKFSRLSLPFKSVTELQDLVGFRIILLFRVDVASVAGAVLSGFDVIEQYDTGDRLKEDQFGYSSIHCILKLPEPWLAVPSMANFGPLIAELQIRTVAQHIWAEASHRLQYKRESTIPVALRRGIYRVSALLETVDLEFDRVLQDRAIYRSEASKVKQDEALNVDLLEAVLDAELPAANKSGDEKYADVFDDLRAFGIETKGRLVSLLRKHRDAILREEQDVVEEIRTAKEPDKAGYEIDPDRVKRGVFYMHSGLVRGMMGHEFGDKWTEYAEKRWEG